MMWGLVLSSGCSNGSDDAPFSQGPTADFSEELTGGDGPFIGAPAPANLQELGYVEAEYTAVGTAVSYRSPNDLTGDGHWAFEPDGSAEYRTRILVRRPQNQSDFSGTVIVEWLNVSGGLDANVEWVNLEEEITRMGHIWVGVSAQLIGVEGGPVLSGGAGKPGVAGTGLKKLDPARYASLSHPGDGYSFDIFTQVARGLREGGSAMGHMRPQHLIAAGESQSAFAMVTYYNGVQPLTQAFDGFLVHSRGAGSLPMVGPGLYAFFTDSLITIPVILRTDGKAPVMNIQAENDTTGFLNSMLVRLPDSDTFRLWEIAGTSHGDSRLSVFGSGVPVNCGLPINDGPQHFVAKAALHSLDAWLRTGVAPSTAQRLDMTPSNPPSLLRNVDGIVLGGVRTPQLDVPVDVLSGVPGPTPTKAACFTLGSTAPLSEERLAELYASPEDYMQRYAASTDAVIQAGFMLEADREAIIADSDPSRIPN
ncbi:MAG: hypothetical protein IPG64_22280 [Haliea sp.]|nr:hypothetical protein [Haliea sp.]